jgi:hypothetical protein
MIGDRELADETLQKGQGQPAPAGRAPYHTVGCKFRANGSSNHGRSV